MANRVQITVEAKDSASGILRGIFREFSAFGNLFDDLTSKKINWGNVTTEVTTLVIRGFKDAIKVTQDYAAEVRDLSFASGASAEEASRLLQVLDDFELTAQDVTQATRIMTRQGLAPTIETLAQLSDQYLTLSTAQEKNAFIIENLGRGGMQWVNALNQGGDALRALGKNVDANLILTDASIKAAEEYRLALDDWNDAVLGLKVSLGNALLPVLTDVISFLPEYQNAMDRVTEATGRTDQRSRIMMASLVDLNPALKTNSSSLDGAAKSANGMAEAYGLLLDKAQKLNGATREQINLTAYQSLQQKLKESGGEITDDEARVLEEAGLALGVFDQKALNVTRTIDDMTDAVANSSATIYDLVAALNALPDEVGTVVTTEYVSINREPGERAGSERQLGGEVFAGAAYQVGERGPEPFFPAQNGRILSNAEALHAMSLGGGGQTNYFYGNVTLQMGAEGMAGVMEIR